jgi:hypothetical protein
VSLEIHAVTADRWIDMEKLFERRGTDRSAGHD